jgi:NitT/TauT family transport system substrate-binding protein
MAEAKTPRMLGALALLALLTAAARPAGADTLTKVTAALVKSSNILVMQHAIDTGLFAKQGLEIDTSFLNNGPAVGSAVVAGSFDIGFAAASAIIYARANNQPVQMFMSLTVEAAPDQFTSWFDAAGRLGPLTLAQLKGKTVVMNATGASCEAQLRGFMMDAGVPWDSIRVLILPFPQMPAALQLGNADVACTIEPFHSAVLLSPEIKGRTLISGTYPNLQTLHHLETIDGFFARQDWLNSHADTALRISRVMLQSSKEVMADPSILATLIVRDLKVAPDVAKAVKPSFNTDPGPIRADDVGTTIDLLHRTGMLEHPPSPADVIFPVDR